jgi:hypothetical protein
VNRQAQLIRALRGPVMLMTLGGLCWAAIHYETRLGVIWPVLVIVFGLMKLLEMLAGRPDVPTGGFQS